MSFGRDMRYARLRLQEEIYSPTARDMHYVRDIAFGSDMRYARLKLQGRIEYHAEPCEAYHFCGAKISRRAKQGISLLRSKNITPCEARHITFAEQKYHAEPCEAYHFSCPTEHSKV